MFILTHLPLSFLYYMQWLPDLLHELIVKRHLIKVDLIVIV